MAIESNLTVIRSEVDAWALVERWLAGRDVGEVEFEGWPVLNITLRGGDYQSSLNSGQMAALIDFKMTIGRTYCAVSHGAYDMRRLRQEEEEQLDFNTEVRPGSSIMDTDLSPLVQALGSVITAHPGSALIAGVLLGLAFVAKPLILKHYENRAKQLEVEERERLLSLALNRGETAKSEMYEKATKKLELHHPQFAQALPDARDAFWKLAAASVNAESMTVAGIEFSQEDLQILSERRRRRASDTSEVTRVFRVAGVRKSGAAYRVQLESKNLVLTAVYRRPQFSDSGLKRLLNCFTSDLRINATVEIRTVDKAQMIGRLLRFSPVQAATVEA